MLIIINDHVFDLIITYTCDSHEAAQEIIEDNADLGIESIQVEDHVKVRLNNCLKGHYKRWNFLTFSSENNNHIVFVNKKRIPKILKKRIIN